MLDAARFAGLVRRLGGARAAAPSFDGLIAAYAEPHRAYHDVNHVDDCLTKFDAARDLAERPDEVEAAIWFHDAVYDPKAKDNEERSAERAAEALSAAGVDSEVLRRVVSLILATKHDREPFGPDEALLIDVDLSILGRAPEVFAAYDAAIRQEYAWVPDGQYRAGRRAVLQRLLDRPAIYVTAYFRDRYEEQARRNLTAAIDRLRD
jgi:predicted metal-dependent HD superfamily phosphohydrolase